MPKPIPKSTLLRFPIVFGGFLVAGGIAFVYRENFLGNIEEQRKALYKDDQEGRKLIEDVKERHQKIKFQN